MNCLRNTLYPALPIVLFLFAGIINLQAATAQQSGDKAASSSTKKSSDAKQAPTTAPATAAPAGAAANTKPVTAAKPVPAAAAKPAPEATTPTPNTPAAPKPAATQQTRPPNSAGMVWVNTDSGIYHKPGSRYYGKTKQGKYMSEADAIKAGYRPAGKN